MREMNYKEINMSKVIITVLSALVLVIIIAVLTRFLTSKKQAAEVVAENPQAKVATEENIWKTTNSISADNNQKPVESNNQTESNQEMNNSQTINSINQEAIKNDIQIIDRNPDLNSNINQTISGNQSVNTNNVKENENQEANTNNAQMQINQDTNNQPKENEPNTTNTSTTTERKNQMKE